MEVVRNELPKNSFLQKVRKLANKKGIVLIFDECTSGFRKNYGGIHKIFKVNPDIVLFGLILVSLGPLNILPKTKPPISEAAHPNNKEISIIFNGIKFNKIKNRIQKIKT